MVKTIVHTFQKMNKDIAESKSPIQFYYDAHNLRFLTNEEVVTGGFSFEKGNDKIITIPNPVIDSVNNGISYINLQGNQLLNYNINNNIQPRNEIESNYYISDYNYKTSQEQIIIGHAIMRNTIILFTTDNNGFDCIWKVDDETYEITLLYLRDLGFSTSNPIQAINNFENDIIDKVYWVDNKNQLRFINIHHGTENQDLEELIDLNFNNIQMVGEFKGSQPIVTDIISGGIHTSGMIQYAYNLYKINGSQTKISPLSNLVSLDKGTNNGGGEVNEIVGSTPVIEINDLDNSYTNLRLYAIKYTSYNQSPSINLILDRDISGLNSITYYDDGNIIEEVTTAEFLFLGSDIIIPAHINSKSSRLFFAKYKEKNFDVNTFGEINSIDTRAYSFQSNSVSVDVYNSLYNNSGVLSSNEAVLNINSNTINNINKVPFKHSTININYDVYNKQFNSNTVGGEGAYLKYEIVRNQIGINLTLEQSKQRFLKDNEIYRLGIQFYNKYGQISLPKWIADFKTIVIDNQSNLNGYYASIKITLKPEFYVWLNDNNNFLDENNNYDDSLKPTGYRLLRAERQLNDRTIICQGLINGMLSQVLGDTTGNDDNDHVTISQERKDLVHTGIKIPSMIRRFDEYLDPMWGNRSYLRLDRAEEYHPEHQEDPDQPTLKDAANEVFRAVSESEWTAGTYQFNKIMQLFSPDILFNTVQNISNVNLEIVGGIENDYNAGWTQVRNIETKVINHEIKVFNAIYPHDVKAYIPGNFDIIEGPRNNIQFHGFFAHADDTQNEMNFVQTYRRYSGNYIKSPNIVNEEIYGNPEIAETGQGRTTYNNDSLFIYYNSIEPLSADLVLANVNSWGAKNATFVLGENTDDIDDRKNIEDLYTDTGINNTSVGLIGEFRIPRMQIYLGNIYGGNSYENKRRSNYIEIGDYNNIDNNIYTAINAGDTFINNFKFTKLVKTTTEVYSVNSEQVTEIVEFRVETTVDLKNRNDQSLQDWDNRFQPVYTEYQKYNTVYSQESNLIIRRDLDYKFKKINTFDTNVIASKVKIPGEIIDSWTDIQPNEVITLDGKHGPINNLVYFKDELYTFQDKGIAMLSILPRVQVQGSDGIAVELGTGQVLNDYKYLTTNSGSINKWGILPTESGLYYLDALNKSFNLIGNEFKGLSDQEGFHKFLLDNININNMRLDNPILHSGVSIGWDKITNDVYLTLFKEDEEKITLSYNLAQQGFSSFYDYHSSMYIFTKGKTITVNPNTNNTLYQNFIGDYNKFYEQNKPSRISFIENPEPMIECTFNNIEYKSEAIDVTNNKEVNYTWERIKAYNEFQDSDLTNLIHNKNIRKLNRKWRLNIPRDKNNKTNRIRNTWSIITLESDNKEGYKYRNHDIITYYNPNYKIIK